MTGCSITDKISNQMSIPIFGAEESNLQQKNKPMYVGIDLGTTNSTVSVFDGSDLTIIRNGQGSVLTPSVVRIDARANVLVGMRARRYLDSDVANTRYEFKRLMGTSNRLDFPAAGIKRLPEELSSEILKSLRNDIKDQTGVLPVCAVISVPALFELHQTSATSEAARLAGFERIELIQEPVASAIAAGWTQEDADGPWMVYDLGGGTFDVSLLDTREGLLRIVGHDGDNFLGGRDFDRMLVDLVLQKLADSGVNIDRANPGHALALRRLHFAAEEAKIELTRTNDAPIFLSDLILDSEKVEVDVFVTRAEYEHLIAPLIERTLLICKRLLTANGLDESALRRLVLVGGPTITPLLRERVSAALCSHLGIGLDPMTLVAQGAALFAGTVGLDGRPTELLESTQELEGPKVWMQYPAMTADLTPFVIGKILDPHSGIVSVELERNETPWRSEVVSCAVDGSFALMVSLCARSKSNFKIFGNRTDGTKVALQPSIFSISHGITLGAPPLARSIGVALANNRIQTYFERGAPLPIRRSFNLLTAETVHPGSDGYALKVPIVQGEFFLAHLCRLVGTLEIPSVSLNSTLPVGSEIELSLELDRGGQLRAKGRIVATNQIFDQVAFLVTPQISLEEIDEALAKVQARAENISRNAFLNRDSGDASQLVDLFTLLENLRRNATAFRGGDLDAGEQVRRGLSDFDATLAELEAEKAWPEMTQEVENQFLISLSWVATYGNEIERSTLNRAYESAKKALAGKLEGEVERQLGLIRDLGWASRCRSPGAWGQMFEYAASAVSESVDLRRSTELVAQGRAAKQRNDEVELRAIVKELWRLSPVEGEEQRRGHGSGLMSF